MAILNVTNNSEKNPNPNNNSLNEGSKVYRPSKQEELSNKLYYIK